MATTSPTRADRAPGRCRAGGGLLGGKDPTDRLFDLGERRGVSPTWMRRNTSGLRLDARLYTQQFRGFCPEAAQLHIVRLVLIHPLHGLVIPLAGLVLLAELPV